MKIAVLVGGISSEREVSVSSGRMVAAALCRLGYQVVLLDISLPVCQKESLYSTDFSVVLSRSNLLNKASPTEINDSVVRYCKTADKVFIALHGGIGEDGTLQKIFDQNGIKYSGSGAEASALAMDKLSSKLVFEREKILTPSYKIYRKNSENIAHNAYPCVVKPSKSGSSVGVTIVKSEGEFKEALRYAFCECETVIVEELIVGRELTVGILHGKPLPVTEIVVRDGFYDYQNKYIKGRATEITPAKIDPQTALLIQKIALQAHNAIGLGVYSRADFILCEKTNLPYILELNALPGLTETSLLPQGAEAVGINFDDLCEKILDLPK